MMLDIFSCVCRLVHLLQCNVSLSFAHFLTGFFIFLKLSFESSLHFLDTSLLLEMWLANIFSYTVICLFIPFNRAEVLNIDVIPFTKLPFYGLCLWCQAEERFPSPSSWKFPPMFFSERFIVYVLHLSLWSILSYIWWSVCYLWCEILGKLYFPVIVALP